MALVVYDPMHQTGVVNHIQVDPTEVNIHTNANIRLGHAHRWGQLRAELVLMKSVLIILLASF